MKKHEQRTYVTQQNTQREKGKRKVGRKRGSKGTRSSLLANVGTSREGFTLFLGPRDPRYHSFAATQDLAKKTERLTHTGGESMRTGSWLEEEGGEGIQSLHFLLEAPGQEVRVEAER